MLGFSALLGEEQGKSFKKEKRKRKKKKSFGEKKRETKLTIQFMLSLLCPFFGSKKKKKASCWLVGSSSSSSSFFQHFIPKGCCVRRDSNSKQTIATNLLYKQHTFDSGGNGDVVCVIEKKKRKRKKRMSREKFAVKAWEVTVRKSQAAIRKRAGLFTTSSVAHADDDEDVESINDSISNQKQSYMEKENGEEVGLEEVERVLSNGDYYTGECTEDNLPHGTGKYLWTDGCMYVGQWFKGKTMGKGKFCWPSGAIYVGDFKNGYMDGMGTYTSSSGETYSGYWLMNLKHGSGAKHYPNGDSYDGEWRRGLQDGHGRYQWINGNHYVGQWKNGVICGNGVLVWANGNRFDGFWEDGVPKGNGTFYWPDGSYYVGVWNKDPDQINGSYCPTQAMSETVPDWDPQQVYLVELNDCKVSPCEKLLLFPSQKAINWFGVGGDHYGQNKGGWKSSNERITRRSSGGAERNCVSDTDDMTPDGRRFMDDNLVSLDDLDLRGTYSLSRPRAIKKQQGETISKGHKNYELMLNLQLGIRHSVGRPAPATSLDLKGSAFDPKEKIWTKFPPEGSKHTPPHPCGEFKWKDYCPLVFRTLRKLLKVDPADYMISICGNDALRELSSPGKSGSFFYLTNDDRYMIKTIKKSEVKVLLRMLPAYYNHVRSFEDTLVTKFFGLHCVKLTGPSQKKVRFVIMGNLFCHEYAIHRRFDLKGSSHGRTTEKPGSEIDENTTLKDLDLNFIFRLRKTWFQQFQRQVDRDCEFLEQERIMDYSLLVGVHFKGAPHPEGRLSGAGKTPKTPKGYVDPDLNSPTDPYKYANVRLGVNMPVRVEHTTRRSNYESQLIGDPTGDYNDVILSFGIIDILQDYDISKKLEHAYKSFQYDPTSISAVDPRLYSRRFRDFIYKAFAEDA